MVRTTRAQRVALKNIHGRVTEAQPPSRKPTPYRHFRRNSVQATIGCDGAIAVQFANMWLCVERDGYTHS